MLGNNTPPKKDIATGRSLVIDSVTAVCEMLTLMAIKGSTTYEPQLLGLVTLRYV